MGPQFIGLKECAIANIPGWGMHTRFVSIMHVKVDHKIGNNLLIHVVTYL